MVYDRILYFRVDKVENERKKRMLWKIRRKGYIIMGVCRDKFWKNYTREGQCYVFIVFFRMDNL